MLEPGSPICMSWHITALHGVPCHPHASHAIPCHPMQSPCHPHAIPMPSPCHPHAIPMLSHGGSCHLNGRTWHPYLRARFSLVG